MTEEKKTVQIQSLLVGFSIIDLVARNGSPMKFNDIHHYTKITKSNLYKYLNTLTSLGVLHRDQESGLYSSGSTLIEYGMAAVNQEDVALKVTPYLEEINLLSKETTLLAVWSHDGPMIIKMIHSRAGLNLGGQVGTLLPIHSAGGKLFAAYKTGALFNDWKEKQTAGLSKEMKNQLDEDMNRIPLEGIAFARDALAPSVASAAIPVFNYEQTIIGAVIIVGFSDNIPLQTDEPLGRSLLEKSIEISRQFGYNPK
ncbi:IclR family transcriptional regulator [Domibacillus epiphyticus]|uniref:IclR family transcriptional regulator n=1 Tax=Domibacillus epiphyticus TaxID=1714355 RepID=A0A1V2A4S3_9BACI|nr:IclR family transcriptional regulator [Domibacillus epiphyticus]OMP66008.1 hypothetical protein BTO28_14555 [Domibacillus epiphyticus]